MNNSCIIVAFALFCCWNTVVFGETPEPPKQESSEKPCSINIWTTKTTYTLGEPIIVYAQEKNEGSKAYRLTVIGSDVIEHVELFRNYKVIINGIKKHRVDEKWNEIPLASFGKTGFSHDILHRWTYMCESGGKSRLMPGWLNLWYDMTVPGEYKVKVTRTFGADADGIPIVIESNELTIEVVKAGFGFMKVDLSEEIKKEREKHEKPKNQ